MPRIELIYDKDCPNVREARSNLFKALTEAGLPARWEEWDRSDPVGPKYAKSYGSPTILADGRDVAGTQPGEGEACCRLYSGPNGKVLGAPTVSGLVSAFVNRGEPAAIRSSSGPKREAGAWKSLLAVLPGVSIGLLPKLTCPACWPAYAGLFSAMGLGFVNYTPYLFPITLGFLLLANLSLGYRARHRRGFGPLLLGVLAGTVVVIGKFIFESEPALLGGISLLVAASAWNVWPRYHFRTDS